MNTKTIFIVLSLLVPILMPFFQGCDPIKCDLPAPTNLVIDQVDIDSFNITWDSIPVSGAVDYRIIIEDVNNQDTIANQITRNTFYGIRVSEGYEYQVTVAARCTSGQISSFFIRKSFNNPLTLIIADEVVMMPGPSGTENWNNCNFCFSFHAATIGTYNIETKVIETVVVPEEDNLVRVYAHLIRVPDWGYEFILKTAVSRNCNRIRVFTNHCLTSPEINLVSSQGIDEDGDDVLLVELTSTMGVAPPVVIIFKSTFLIGVEPQDRTFSIYTEGGESLNVTSTACRPVGAIDWEMPCEEEP